MAKKILILILVFFWGLNIMNSIAFAQGGMREVGQSLEEIENILSEIRAIPDLVSPDSIYTGTMLKGLYYQNNEMIRLLKEIKELLRQGFADLKEEEE